MSNILDDPAQKIIAVAYINGIANVGGLVGPEIVGFFYDSTGSYASGIACVGAVVGVTCAGSLLLRKLLKQRNYKTLKSEPLQNFADDEK